MGCKDGVAPGFSGLQSVLYAGVRRDPPVFHAVFGGFVDKLQATLEEEAEADDLASRPGRESGSGLEW
jgi:hypothetical protein